MSILSILFLEHKEAAFLKASSLSLEEIKKDCTVDNSVFVFDSLTPPISSFAFPARLAMREALRAGQFYSKTAHVSILAGSSAS